MVFFSVGGQISRYINPMDKFTTTKIYIRYEREYIVQTTEFGDENEINHLDTMKIIKKRLDLGGAWGRTISITFLEIYH